jgi:glycosyltransferase involved in cell wall biosynthesis
MAGECCIITTAYRGIVDLIDDGVEGYFVESRNAKQLADKIEILCKDREKMKLMKGAAKERAFKQFAEDKYIKGVIDVIKEVV